MSPGSRARHSIVTRRVTVALSAACLLLAGLIVPAAVSTAQAGPSVQPRIGATPTTTYAVIRVIDVGVGPVGVAVDQDDDTVYVTNFDADSVSVINGRTGQRTGTIGVGDGPDGVAINQGDDTVYVANSFYLSTTVSVINGATGLLTDDTITVGRGPTSVAVNQEDDTVYVTWGDFGFGTGVDDTVSVLNGRDLDDSVAVGVGNGPSGVAVNQRDDTVYAANLYDATVSVINGRRGQLTDDTIPVGAEPIGVAVKQDDGTVYVTNNDSNTVSVINGATGLLTGTITVGSRPWGVAVDQVSGTVYVANYASNTVSVINGRTGLLTDDTMTVGSSPRGVAVDDSGINQGLVYVTNSVSNSVSVIGRVSPTSVPSSGNAGDAVTINVDVPQVTYDVDDSTVASVSFGGTTVTPTPLAGDAWQVAAPAGTPGTSVPVTVTFRGGLTASAGTFTYNVTTVYPPSAPLDVTAVAGDAEAEVSWAAPASPGSYPVSTYEVRSTPAGKSCLATTLTCTITGLANGTAYSFEARALNGAGWGPWSAPSNTVTPIAPVPPSITIAGSRGTGADRLTITVTGTSTGLTGTQVRAHVKLRGQSDYQPGRLVDLDTNGRFTWQRTTGRKAYIYFTSDTATSNRVIIPAATG